MEQSAFQKFRKLHYIALIETIFSFNPLVPSKFIGKAFFKIYLVIESNS